MKLSIYSLKKTLYNGEARALNCKTATGEITVLDNHRPFISILEDGQIRIMESQNKERIIPVQGGFIEVRAGSEVRLLVA